MALMEQLSGEWKNCVVTARSEPARLRAARRLRQAGRVESIQFPEIGELAATARDCERSAMKVRDVVRMLQAAGWVEVRTRGSHRQFKHPTQQGRDTTPGKQGDDLAAGTLNSILKQAGLKRR